jgi:hypothetical protein
MKGRIMITVDNDGKTKLEDGSYHRNLKLSDNGVIGDYSKYLVLSDRRKEILTEWLAGQIAIINEKKMSRMGSNWFVYTLVPSTIGSKLEVYSHATGAILDLTLIDNEEF